MAFGWDWFQQIQIQNNSKTAGEAEIKSRYNTHDIELLEEKIDALSLVCRSMWELLSEKHGLTISQLEERIEQLDLKDGKLDGKLSNNVTHCPDCSHKLNKRHKNCFYCGAKVSNNDVFI
jgi:hypothetical protein